MARTILILTSKTGGGHISLAESLRDLLLAKHGDAYIIELVDPQPKFFLQHYRMVSRYALWLWRAEYKLMDTPKRAMGTHRLFMRTVVRPLKAAVKRLNPDLIISTHPYTTYAPVEMLKKMKLDIPFAMLFTDANLVHATWLTERRADATFAPTRETYQQALEAGFDEERLHLVGWPVRAQFYQADVTSRSEMLKSLGLDPTRFTIFFQGGGEGAARFGRTVERVLNIDTNVQIILATGTNKNLLAQFQDTERLYPLPFTKEIARYMVAADIVMGKAGPNMLMETVTLGKPFIATSYIPGQEEPNLEFIERYKLGWVALNAKKQIELLDRLMKNPGELEATRKTVGEYRAWNLEQTEEIVSVLEQLLVKEGSRG